MPLESEREARTQWGLERPALGLSLGGAALGDPASGRLRWVELAEALGLHSVWLPEMHFERGVCPAPLLELAAFAPVTRSLRLGTTSLLLPLHPPDEIAAQIAALDQLSSGRALIGLGRGFQRRMLEAFRVPPAEKRDRFDEALDRMLALWSDGHRKGDLFAPCQSPHPPLAVAAFGPKGLAQAARRGLPYLASPVETVAQIEENQRRHREGMPDPRQRPLAPVMRTIFVSESERELEAIRARLASELPGRRAGLPEAVNAAIDSPLDARTLIGTPEAVTERLVQDRARLGIDLLIVRPQIAGIERSVLERSLRWLAETVWPAVVARTTV
jgi:alkanesulfonate monooxygenase SsuD/methylene tetrahydromethanopterin reductase-like flavin-dependent oxidoreductase (luciferase family)